jgi:hypothetical protein
VALSRTIGMATKNCSVSLGAGDPFATKAVARVQLGGVSLLL